METGLDYVLNVGGSGLASIESETGIETFRSIGGLASSSSSCQMGSEVILRRIVKKLFHQINQLQPTELDDEFIYQTSITYSDYQGLLRYSREEENQQINCASLNRLENILSNFLTSAFVKRPTQTSPLGSVGAAFHNIIQSGAFNSHIIIVFLLIGLMSWFISKSTGLRACLAWPLSLVMTGFVEFVLHKNKLQANYQHAMKHCENPSFIGRLAALLNIDYDNCNTRDPHMETNIGLVGIEYLAELIVKPMVPFGRAMNSYLNQFGGLNYWLFGPFFSIVILFVSSIVIVLIFRSQNHSRPTATPQTNRKKTNMKLQNSEKKAIK